MSVYVYRAFDANDRLLYVGQTVSVETRLRAHERHSPWFIFMARVEQVAYPTREGALEAEAEAIATEFPRWNVHGRSPEHPDGPIKFSLYSTPHLAAEVGEWRQWIADQRAAS